VTQGGDRPLRQQGLYGFWRKDIAMEQQAFLLDLMRLKFGFMACFHYIFVPLTLGLAVSAACMETAFVRTRAAAWRIAAHFWFRTVCSCR
jgi:Cytochrome bd terminal oxidase subunit I